MREWRRYRLIGVPEFRPRPMSAVAVVAHVERDRAGASGDIERLLGINRQRRDAVLITHRLYKLPIADGDIVRRLHYDILSTTQHRRRRDIVVLALTEVDRSQLPRNAPERAVEIAGAVADAGGGGEGFAEGSVGQAAVRFGCVRNVSDYCQEKHDEAAASLQRLIPHSRHPLRPQGRSRSSAIGAAFFVACVTADQSRFGASCTSSSFA